MHRLSATLVLALGLPLLAHAADQTVRGSVLLVKDPGTPEKRKVAAKAKEIGSTDTIVGDPTASGAAITITLAGGTPSSDTHALPAGVSAVTGKPFWNGSPATCSWWKWPDA